MKSVLFPIFKHALCILIIGVRRFIILEVSILSPFCFPYLNMPSFQLMCCQEVHHSGSFYDGLRCGTADEFDLNLILTIEVLRSNLKVSLNLEEWLLAQKFG
jgi:hypothetical protein